MCGIVGSVNKELNENILDLIEHRGPDAKGMIQQHIENSLVCLGHTRLAIQDLSSAGSQPMTTDCGNYTIIFNGEVYNHLDLRGLLPDVRFKGHSDTETILYYIAKFGIESVKDLNGIFAFSFLDKLSGKLFLARDVFGVKPLYYKEYENTLIYSSELKTILSIEENELDYSRLYTFLTFRFNPSPQTLFKDIDKLEPGYYIEYSLTKNKILNKIFYSYHPSKNNDITEQEALIRYEELLINAIKRQLLSDVPIAILLSGGVDSALVTKIAQDISGEQLSTYTAGYNITSDANELTEARETSKILNTNHHEIILSEEMFFDTLPSLVKTMEEPLGSQSVFPINFLSKKIHEDGFKVALTGQGVDEPWAGYGRYNTEIIFDIFPSIIMKPFAPLQKLLKHDKIKRGFRALASQSKIERFIETYSVFNSDMIESMTNSVFNLEHKFFLYDLMSEKFTSLALNDYKGVDAMSILDARMNLSDDLLLYTDKISMQHSLELRVPFLDLELMQFVESLPSKLKVTLFDNKILHKKLSEKFLPNEIIYRKKKGFFTPRKEWFQGELGDIYLNLILEDTGSFTKIFNKDYIKNLFIAHKKGKVNYEKQIYLMIIMYYWINYFVDGNEI